LGERSKTVEDYVGAPKPLRDLERHIDEAAGVQRWVRIDTATVKEMVRSGWRANGDEGKELLRTALKVRIVAMGDSTTAGTPAFKSPRELPPNGSGDETSQYAYWLMKAHPDWEVINQGINAQRSDQIRARFEEDVVAKKPAVVVIIAGVNDVYQGRGVEHVKTELAATYKRAKDAGIKVVAGSIIPYNTATADQNARMHAINEWIGAQPAADANIRFVDTRAAVAAPDNPDRLVSSPDGLHPDAAGYRKMAEAIERVILEWLRT
jgi:lysophospholipase L1-like esterase